MNSMCWAVAALGLAKVIIRANRFLRAAELQLCQLWALHSWEDEVSNAPVQADLQLSQARQDEDRCCGPPEVPQRQPGELAAEGIELLCASSCILRVALVLDVQPLQCGQSCSTLQCQLLKTLAQCSCTGCDDPKPAGLQMIARLM